MSVNIKALKLPTMLSGSLRSVQQQNQDHALPAYVHASTGISVADAIGTASSSTGSQKLSFLDHQQLSGQQKH